MVRWKIRGSSELATPEQLAKRWTQTSSAFLFVMPFALFWKRPNDLRQGVRDIGAAASHGETFTGGGRRDHQRQAELAGKKW